MSGELAHSSRQRSDNPGKDSTRIAVRDWPATQNQLAVVEEPRTTAFIPPEILLNESTFVVPDCGEQLDIHGTYLIQRDEVTLFGPNHLVAKNGLWSCESRTFKSQFIDLVLSDGFKAAFPGVKPTIARDSDTIWIDTKPLREIGALTELDEPVFLATPLEPDNWARWIATVIPKSGQFKVYGNGRRFFCRAGHPWQLALLRFLGIGEEELLEHNPGISFLCRDVMTTDYSITNMTISTMEQAIFQKLAGRCIAKRNVGDCIFVSRLTHSLKYPNYRVLQNEQELVSHLRELGFAVVEPETLTVEDQISVFANAKLVVCLGGAALYNTVFCRPGTSVVTIESGPHFLVPHLRLLSSLGHRYGVIMGRQDPNDLTAIHKGWVVDVNRVCRSIRDFAP